MLNDDIAWWYVAIGVATLIPLVVATFMAVLFFTKDTPDSRGNLTGASILLIIGVSCFATWNVIYFLFFYKKATVVTGNDGVGFVKATRKQEVVFTLFFCAVVVSAFAYFLCVIGTYKEAMEKREARLKQERAARKLAA